MGADVCLYLQKRRISWRPIERGLGPGRANPPQHSQQDPFLPIQLQTLCVSAHTIFETPQFRALRAIVCSGGYSREAKPSSSFTED